MKELYGIDLAFECTLSPDTAAISEVEDAPGQNRKKRVSFVVSSGLLTEVVCEVLGAKARVEEVREYLLGITEETELWIQGNLSSENGLARGGALRVCVRSAAEVNAVAVFDGDSAMH